MSNIEPFVRWAGGKSWLIQHLPDLIGDLQFEHYHEPFLGGAAVFFALDHTKKAYLSDTNEQLINSYAQIRDNPIEVINCFMQFHNTEQDYYRIRDGFEPRSTSCAPKIKTPLSSRSANGLTRKSTSPSSKR